MIRRGDRCTSRIIQAWTQGREEGREREREGGIVNEIDPEFFH